MTPRRCHGDNSQLHNTAASRCSAAADADGAACSAIDCQANSCCQPAARCKLHAGLWLGPGKSHSPNIQTHHKTLTTVLATWSDLRPSGGWIL